MKTHGYKRVIEAPDSPNQLRQACLWINRNWGKIQSKEWPNGFDYPDYFGLPKSIRNRLSSEDVDYIQEQL